MATAINQNDRRRRQTPDYRAKAVELNLDVDGLDDTAVRHLVGEEEARRFYVENREWIDAHNAWVEKNGLPLERYRLF